MKHIHSVGLIGAALVVAMVIIQPDNPVVQVCLAIVSANGLVLLINTWKHRGREEDEAP